MFVFKGRLIPVRGGHVLYEQTPPPSAQAAKMHLNIILDLLERDPQTARLEVWEEEKKGDLKVSNYSTA